MRPPAEPVILPPRGKAGLDDVTLDWLASLLDDVFRIPGTSIRFGLDPLIGLLPGVGDLLTGAASFLIILSAWQRRVPKVTVARMMANVMIDTLVGAMPLVGDVFDVAWKSNKKNIGLLQRASLEPARHDWRDWVFLLGLVVLMIFLIAIPIATLWLIAHLLRHV